MKERQRWQPEEDELLRAYVKQYGPRDWGLVSERTGKALDRDAKSCVERWKNYLKPGIKKGPLSEEEQSLVVRLQEKYGNKWKKIAAEVPGRTAKRLGKWWEVYKEKEKKKERGLRFGGEEADDRKTNYSHMLASFAKKFEQRQADSSCSLLPAPPAFLVQPLRPPLLDESIMLSGPPAGSHAARNSSWLPNTLSVGATTSGARPELDIDVSPKHPSTQEFLQGSSSNPSLEPETRPRDGSSTTRKSSSLPPWMCNLPSSSSSVLLPQAASSGVAAALNPNLVGSDLRLSLSTSSRDAAVGLDNEHLPESPDWSQGDRESTMETTSHDATESLTAHARTVWRPHKASQQTGRSSPSMDINRLRRRPVGSLDSPYLANFVGHRKDLDERRKPWFDERKEVTWKLRRLEQQLDAEKLAKISQKKEEVDACIQALREEERKYLECLELEYQQKVQQLHRDAGAQGK